MTIAKEMDLIDGDNNNNTANQSTGSCDSSTGGVIAAAAVTTDEDNNNNTANESTGSCDNSTGAVIATTDEDKNNNTVNESTGSCYNSTGAVISAAAAVTTDEDNNNVVDDNNQCQWTDHFNDDMTREILQHLPVDDMLGLVGVCRQFRRCLQDLWLRQDRLTVKLDTDRRYNLEKLAKNSPESCFRYEWDVSAERLEFVLQRMTRLKELAIASRKTGHDRQVVDTIIGNYPPQSLTTVKLNVERLNGQLLAAFGQHFGTGIQNLVFQCPHYQRPSLLPLLRYCPNLCRVKNIRLRDLIVAVDDDLMDTKTPGSQLIEIKKLFTDFDDLSLMDQLPQRCPNLESLKINIDTELASLALLVTSIVQLLKLSLLAIDYSGDIGVGGDFAQHLKSIGQQCSELRDMSLTIRYESILNLGQLLKSLKKFHRLERFTFCMDTHYRRNQLNEQHRDIPVLDYLSNTGWHLKRLSIKSIGISDVSLANIGSVVPNLRQLKIGTNEQLTDESLIAISKLPELRILELSQIKLGAKFLGITDTGMLSLIKGCQKLYRLDIFSLHEESLTVQSLKAMIAKSIEQPKQEFIYHTGDWHIPDVDNYYMLLYPNGQQQQQQQQPVMNLLVPGLRKLFFAANFPEFCKYIGCVDENDINMIF